MEAVAGSLQTFRLLCELAVKVAEDRLELRLATRHHVVQLLLVCSFSLSSAAVAPWRPAGRPCTLTWPSHCRRRRRWAASGARRVASARPAGQPGRRGPDQAAAGAPTRNMPAAIFLNQPLIANEKVSLHFLVLDDGVMCC